MSTRPTNILCEDHPGDTLHRVACVLLAIDDTDDDGYPCDDMKFGRYLMRNACINALEYESTRVTAKENKK